jgi:hypothetical protein
MAQLLKKRDTMSLNEIESTNNLFSLADLQYLRTSLQGSALIAGEIEYEEACRTIEANFVQRPAIVVLPEITADVRAAVQFAHQHQLPILTLQRMCACA